MIRMIDRERNSIRYMALRSNILKLFGRLKDDINHYDVFGDDIELYDLGKLNEMRRIADYLVVALDEADKAGERKER